MYSAARYNRLSSERTWTSIKILSPPPATPIVLAILAEGDSCGYAIFKRVSD